MLPPLARERRKHADYGAVGHGLGGERAVPANEVITVPDPDDPVQHVVAVAPVQGHIVFAQARRWGPDDHQVPVLVQHGFHAHAPGLVNEHAVAGEQLLERRHHSNAFTDRSMSRTSSTSAAISSRGASYFAHMASTMALAVVSCYGKMCRQSLLETKVRSALGTARGDSR